jgi:hypothetical protein
MDPLVTGLYMPNSPAYNMAVEAYTQANKLAFERGREDTVNDYARYIQDETGCGYVKATKLVEKYLDEAKKSYGDTKRKLLELTHAEARKYVAKAAKGSL